MNFIKIAIIRSDIIKIFVILILSILITIVVLFFTQGTTIKGKITRNGMSVTNAEICIDDLEQCILALDGNYIIPHVIDGNHTLIVKKNNITIFQEKITVRREKFNVMFYNIGIIVTSATPNVIPKVNITNS